jgi:hypothetical protein
MRESKRLSKQYLRRSKKRFLEGTRASSPFEAVISGARTLKQWTDILNFERELELQNTDRALNGLQAQNTELGKSTLEICHPA